MLIPEDHPERVENKSDQQEERFAVQSLRFSLGFRWANTRLKHPAFNAVCRHPVSVGVMTLVAVVSLQGIAHFAENLDVAQTPPANRDLSAEARLVALKDATIMSVLGVCGPELTARAEIEHYRAGAGAPKTAGAGEQSFRTAAQVADAARLPCKTGSPDHLKSYNVQLTNNSAAMVGASDLIWIEASSACDFVANQELQREDHLATRQENVAYDNAALSAARNLAQATGQQC